ncbi:MAG: class IV adenylate cyclase [Methanobacteriota archaeon]|nr:MAG: class IV adenylate cyclase [Euryarchaeota archaeon]
MLEVEMKYRSPGNDGIVTTLGRLGARKLCDEIIEDTYYAHPGRRFKETDEALRLRKRDDGSEQTYKGPRMTGSSAKAREELTLRIDDWLTMDRVLKRLGFVDIVCVKKRRVSFALDLLRVDIDDIEGLGQFVEIELMTEDPSRAKLLIHRAEKELRLVEKVKDTYLELILKAQ